MKEVVKNFHSHPYCKPEHLGLPIPNEFGVSVCLPTHEATKRYEENDPAVHAALKTKYPRFGLHDEVVALIDRCQGYFKRDGYACLPFPSERSAIRAFKFMIKHGAESLSIKRLPASSMHAVFYPEEFNALARSFWQHSGEIVSARQAASYNRGEAPVSRAETEHATAALTSRIATILRQPESRVFIFPTGMAAMHAAFRVCEYMRHARYDSSQVKTAQIGFPYVDSRLIQEKFGNGLHFFPEMSAQSYAELDTLASNRKLSGIFCEVPGNPLLRTPDMVRLNQIAHKAGAPLVVDETIANYSNVDLVPFADMIVSSLTKSFSGIGDVMGGALVVPHDSELAKEIQEILALDYENICFVDDLEKLLENSWDFEIRSAKANRTTEALVDYLAHRPEVASIHHPSLVDRQQYDLLKKFHGGYGSLFSIVLQGGQESAKKFFDELEVNKGPSLGTDYTLACFYTLLAHYNELDAVAKLGIDRNLIRVSVGQEPFGTLKARFDAAFASLNP